MAFNVCCFDVLFLYARLNECFIKRGIAAVCPFAFISFSFCVEQLSVSYSPRSFVPFFCFALTAPMLCFLIIAFNVIVFGY